MTKGELEKYRTALEAKKAEIVDALKNREDIAIEKAADAIDEVQLAGERELAIRNLDRESGLLRKVRAALGRIEDGSYGTCMHCEDEISPKRLKAVPWAPFCIRCQEAADRHEFEAGETWTNFWPTPLNRPAEDSQGASDLAPFVFLRNAPVTESHNENIRPACFFVAPVTSGNRWCTSCRFSRYIDSVRDSHSLRAGDDSTPPDRNRADLKFASEESYWRNCPATSGPTS